MSKASIPVTLLAFKPILKGAVVGVASVTLGRALRVNDVMVLTSNGRTWANLPSKPQIGKDGVALKDDRGKFRYSPILEWQDKESLARFSAAVISAIEAAHGPIASMAGSGS